MDKILYTAFKGKNNSSKVLLDNILCNNEDKLYLTNSFDKSVEELKQRLQQNNYDLIVCFGQCPLDSNTIKLEKKAKYNNDSLSTNCKINSLKMKLEENGYTVIISEDAGTYLCNNIYYHGLKYIKDNNLNTLILFIHIPSIKNIDNIELLAKIFS